MKFAFISLFTEMFSIFTANSIIKRAVQQKLITYTCFNPRDFSTCKHRKVDNAPYGGGPGMVIMYQPLVAAIKEAKIWCDSKRTSVVYLSPQGKTFDHKIANCYKSEYEALILICGHYEGIDQRVIDNWVDFECSIGDYILTGGELAAMVFADSITRLLPNVIGNHLSIKKDSFVCGILDYPHYTKPREIDGHEVPEILFSGDHEKVKQWRHKQALIKTKNNRPELVK